MNLKTQIWTLLGVFTVCTPVQSAPEAIVIPASQYFEGNDGPWSTFDVRIGTPEQYIRVLPSTASPYTIVPLSESGCTTEVFGTVPPDCAVSRGNLFDLNQSSSWVNVGRYGINQDGVGLEANLGYSQRAQFGLEKLGVGLTGPSIGNQTVAGIATPQPFYLGIFGLNNQPLNFTSLGNTSTATFVTALKDEGKIPSISWSYTAGAKYRLKQVYGQLIFSGYDTSRFRENKVSFSMAEDITRDLVVALHSISYSGSTSATLLSSPIDILIDSTDSNLWLPAEACDAFEKAFGLTLDEKSGLYLINDTHRNSLLDSNAQVSFRISDIKEGGETVTIVLPYAAFDLTAKSPLVGTPSHYFPLKRANSSTQYTLGRVFLQEAYLTVDYERKVFNVSPCVWDQGAKENIVTITSGGSDPRGGGGSSSGLSGGSIAGIVVGSILGALLIAAIITVFILRKRRKWLGKGFAIAAREPQPDESVLKGPVFNTPSRHDSTPESSVPFSADDISATRSRSTAENSRPASGRIEEQVSGGSPAELDGRATAVNSKPDVEANGHLVPRPLPAVAENPGGVHELPGTGVETEGSTAIETEQGVSNLQGGALSGHGRAENNSPTSTLTSTTGGGGYGARVSKADSELVSPETSVYRHGDRPF